MTKYHIQKLWDFFDPFQVPIYWYSSLIHYMISLAFTDHEIELDEAIELLNFSKSIEKQKRKISLPDSEE